MWETVENAIKLLMSALFLGGGVWLFFRLSRAQRAEKELILKDFKDEETKIDDSVSKLSDQQLADKNNARFGSGNNGDKK